MFRAKLQTRAQVQTRSTRAVVAAAQMTDSKKALFATAAAVALTLAPAAAYADLISDLQAKTAVNLELNNKKRLASSYSNFARSRTVTDGTCKFPSNVLGCDVGNYAGDVAYIADDIKLECADKVAGKCASNISIPQKNQ